MKKLLVFLTLLFMVGSGYAQQQRQSNVTGMKVLGQAVAAEFGQWYATVLAPGVSSGSQTVTLASSSFVVPDGMPFMPITTAIPIYINDFSLSETVTPSAVNCAYGAPTCTFTATFSHAHPSNFSIGSGTYGLQEAIAYMSLGNLGGMVMVTPDWRGATAMITGAAGSSSVLILDTRAGYNNWYAWNGSAYAITLSISSVGGLVPVLTNPVPVTQGGTGLVSLTANGVLYGNGTSNAAVTAQGPANSVLTANAGAPSFSANPILTTLTTTGAITMGSNPGLTGIINLPNNTYIAERNAANTADILAIGVNTGNLVNIGNGAGVFINGILGVGGPSAGYPLQVHTATNRSWLINDSPGGASFQALNDAASAYVGGRIDAGPLLINGQSGGQAEFPDGTVGAPSISFISDATTGLYKIGGSVLAFAAGGTQAAIMTSTSVQLPSSVSLNWNSDSFLIRDNPNIIAMKNGTTPQTLRLYGTTVGPEYIAFDHNGTNGEISTAGGNINLIPGTNIAAVVNGAIPQEFRVYGTTTGPRYLSLNADSTNFNIITSGTGVLQFGVAGSTLWGLQSTGVLYPSADNSYDLGVVSANRIRHAYIGTSVILGTTNTVTLVNDGANALALENGTAGQQLHIYGTTTGTDYLNVFANSNNTAGVDSGLNGDHSGVLSFNGPSNGWRINDLGDQSLTSGGDNSQDIGHNGQNRPRTLYLGTSLNVAGKLVANSSGLLSTYNNVATAGNGVYAIVARARETAQTGAVSSVVAYTVGAADGTFEVGASVLATTATTYNFSITVTFTDESNTSRTMDLPVLESTSSGLVAALTNTRGPDYAGVPVQIRAKAGTTITVATSGTFTTVTYNIEGTIAQIG